MVGHLMERFDSHVALCSALGLAAVAVAPGNEAEATDIVYYQPNGGAGWVIPATLDGLYINVETQATGTAGAAVAGWDINPYSVTTLAWYHPTSTGMMRFPGVMTGSAGSLALGTPVSSAASFGLGGGSDSRGFSRQLDFECLQLCRFSVRRRRRWNEVRLAAYGCWGVDPRSQDHGSRL